MWVSIINSVLFLQTVTKRIVHLDLEWTLPSSLGGKLMTNENVSSIVVLFQWYRVADKSRPPLVRSDDKRKCVSDHSINYSEITTLI